MSRCAVHLKNYLQLSRDHFQLSRDLCRLRFGSGNRLEFEALSFTFSRYRPFLKQFKTMKFKVKNYVNPRSSVLCL